LRTRPCCQLLSAAACFVDRNRFDTFAAALCAAPSRRTALRLLAGLTLAGLGGQSEARKKHKNKRKCAKAGQVPSKKRKQCCSKLVQDSNGVCTTSCSMGPLLCDVCHICDAQSGQCVPQPDGFGCFLPNGGACGDRYTCQGGVCTAVPLVCAPPDQCHEPGVCGPSGGVLCVYPNKTDGTPCNAGNICVINDVCTDGVCTGTPRNGFACGTQTQPGGGTTRCCNGGCPNRDCLPAGQICETFENCNQTCCSGGSFGPCPGPSCVCGAVGPGGWCASDTDCAQQGHCVCASCCVPPGMPLPSCASDPGKCCSGTFADNGTCA